VHRNSILTLTLLTWRIWWAPNNARKWHRGFNSTFKVLIGSNKMQQYAGIYLLQNHSTCFGCPSHQSSGVHKSVTAASGTGHSIWATAFLQCGLNISKIMKYEVSWKSVLWQSCVSYEHDKANRRLKCVKLYLNSYAYLHGVEKVTGKVRLRTGHEGPEGEKVYSSTVSLTTALDEVGGQRQSPAALPPGMTRYP
jgi:hypothetical protein